MMPTMSSAAIAVMLIGSVVVRVEEARGVPAADVAAALDVLDSVVTVRTAKPARRDQAPLPDGCAAAQACADAIRQRNSALDLLVVRFIGIPAKVRMIVERIGKSESQIDLPAERATWRARITVVGHELFADMPPTTRAAPSSHVLAEPMQPAQPKLLPWVLIGGGIVAGAIGVSFGMQNRIARREASLTTDQNRYDELDRQAFLTGLGANVLYGLAIASVATGTVMFLTD